MRTSFAVALLLSLLLSGGYVYVTVSSPCPAPLSYSLQTLDERFGLTREEAKLAIAQAEALWEEATAKDLFTLQEEGELTINFVFDDRQALVKKEETFKEKLDATVAVSDAMRNTYAELVNRYNSGRLVFLEASSMYEKRLASYNTEVEKYNERGGAPSDVYARLEEERRSLAQEENRLNTQTASLNTLVAEINSVGEKANRIITSYNQGVDTYNATFGGEREFIQGDYKDKVIHIYTYDSHAELVLVLVHELGHALSLEHVENGDSAMHYLLKSGEGETPLSLSSVKLSENDLAEFERVCGEKSFVEVLEVVMDRISDRL